jgi:hypothetical protein
MGAGGELGAPAFSDVQEKVSWVEKFVRLGASATEAAKDEHDRSELLVPQCPPKYFKR